MLPVFDSQSVAKTSVVYPCGLLLDPVSFLQHHAKLVLKHVMHAPTLAKN